MRLFNPTALYMALALSLVGCSEKRYHVPTSSMEPTIPAGTFVVVDRSAYRNANPIRWDVVTFEPPMALYPAGTTASDPKQTWIMRVIGIPGDSVDFSGTDILVNGKVLKLPAKLSGLDYVGLAELRTPPGVSRTKITLSRDEYFVLGDNTTNANDSRFWGALTRDRISGRLNNP